MFHAIQININNCTGCTHCMQSCPTTAIRVKNGKAYILSERCIDCGECARVCPADAVMINENTLSDIQKYPVRVALIPAALLGQVPRNIGIKHIIQSLINEGFTDVYPVEKYIPVLNEAIHQYQQENTDRKPIISAFCPAVVRLIQVRFPGILENIMLLKSPMELAALGIRNEFVNKNYADKEIGIFYITPCSAQIEAIKSPEGEDYSAINGVISMSTIYNKIFLNLSQEKNITSDSSSYGVEFSLEEHFSWSLTNGEAHYASGRSLAIDGIHNIIEFLDNIENEEGKNFSFLELRACDQSCAGGILNPVNRFLSRERIEKRISARTHTKPTSLSKETKEYLLSNILVNKLEPRIINKLDDNVELALQKMEKIRSLMCYLPGIDCGACGTPSCKTLAEDIVLGNANVSDCIFIQKNMMINNKLSTEHSYHLAEKTWGKSRFRKDCTKKGAKDEYNGIG